MFIPAGVVQTFAPGYIFCRYLFLYIFSGREASSSQKTTGRIFTNFSGLIDYLRAWKNLHSFGNRTRDRDVAVAINESRKIGVFRGKIFFVALLFRNGLEYWNGDVQLRSALNAATSCANTVMIGGVTLQKRLLILYFCEKKLPTWAYPAYYLRTCSINLDQLW